MTLTETKKHISNLNKLFPESFISTTSEFYGESDEGDDLGLWTGFLEDGTIDEWGHDNSGMGYYVEPRLLKYLEKHGLDLEPYDAGTMMIWKW
jgi:hypothetical protein